MTDEDVRRIETALEIQLPESYRAAVLAFPLPAFVGNADTEIWDDADKIIDFNRELRSGFSGSVSPWPRHMFAMGHGGDGSPSAIDLSSPHAAVWWVDRCHLDGAGSCETHSSFDAWLAKYVADLRHDCEADCIDADGTPADREAALEASARGGCRALATLVVALVLVAVLIVVVAWVRGS